MAGCRKHACSILSGMGAGLLLLYSGAGHLLLEHVDLLHQLADHLVNSSLNGAHEFIFILLYKSVICE